MKFYMGLGSKVKRMFVQAPATKQDLVGENKDGGLGFENKLPVKNLDFGSRDEAFFDSRAWLDSDCEDDFYSVNGEFTPSRGSTPNFQTSMKVNPLFVEKFWEAKSQSSSSTTSPPGRKKLAELFRESFHGEKVSNEDIATNLNTQINGKSHLPLKSVNGTPSRSGTNSVSGSEGTPNRDSNRKKARRLRVVSCCLPSMVHSFSFNERRQKTSPATAA